MFAGLVFVMPGCSLAISVQKIKDFLKIFWGGERERERGEYLAHPRFKKRRGGGGGRRKKGKKKRKKKKKKKRELCLHHCRHK